MSDCCKHPAGYSFADGHGKRHMVCGDADAIHALSVVFVRRDVLETLAHEGRRMWELQYMNDPTPPRKR